MHENSALQSSMIMVMIPQETLHRLEESLNLIEHFLKNNLDNHYGEELLDVKEVQKILGISPKTFQYYRDNRSIQFSQIGRKIYVKRKDLMAFIEKHHIKSIS